MTFKTPGFDFIFAHREKLETRLAKTKFRIQRAKDKIEDLMDDPITHAQQRKIGRLEGLISMREWRTRGLANDIEELTNALPKDEFTFSNYKEGDRISSLDLHVTDSPYDDTYVGGTRLKVSVNATRRGIYGQQGYTTNSNLVKTFDDEKGMTSFGGSNIKKMMNEYEDVTVTLFNQDNHVLTSQQLL